MKPIKRKRSGDDLEGIKKILIRHSRIGETLLETLKRLLAERKAAIECIKDEEKYGHR